jgi:hypothetical protein
MKSKLKGEPAMKTLKLISLIILSLFVVLAVQPQSGAQETKKFKKAPPEKMKKSGKKLIKPAPGVVAKLKPDLYVHEWTSQALGTTCTFPCYQIYIANNSVVESKPFKVNVYSRRPGESFSLVKQLSCPSLKKNPSGFPYGVAVKLPYPLDIQEFYVKVVIDPGNQVAELDEGNNSWMHHWKKS